MSAKTRIKNKPQSPMSSYACFVQVIREEHKKKHPNEPVVISEFTTKCAEKWKQMTQEEKRRFDEMAEMDRLRHGQEMDQYVPIETTKRNKRKRTKDPNEPKRAWSAFFFYCDEFRPEIKDAHPEWRVGDVAKELGKRWETCFNREKYEDLARIDKERYIKDMKSFKEGSYVATKGPKVTATTVPKASPDSLVNATEVKETFG